MDFQAWVTLGLLCAAIVLFATEWVRVDVAALLVVTALMLTAVLTPAEALSGFSNPAVLTIAALFVVGEAVLQTGWADRLGRRVLALAGGGEARLVIVLMAAVALFSSLVSSTGTVAVLLPAVIVIARSARLSPARLLIPLAYGALLGGALTLIGTPSNLIVSDLLRGVGLPPFTFFSFTPVGLALTTTGILFMALIGRRLLPYRQPAVEPQHVETPGELLELYRLPDNLFRLRVRAASELAGHSIAASGLRQEFQVNALEIQRPRPLRPTLPFLAAGEQAQRADVRHISLAPDAGVAIQAGDVLVVQGDDNAVARAAARWNLGVQPATAADEQALIGEETGVAEVILPPRSDLQGKTLVETRFRNTFGLMVLGLSRGGESGGADLKTTRLRAGDVLLVQGPWKNVLALERRRQDFVVVGQPEAMRAAPKRDKALLAAAVVAGMLALMATGVIPMATASLLAALTLVLTGCLTVDEAYQAIDWRTVVMIAGMLPMSIALEKVALVGLAARALTQQLGPLGPEAVLAGLFLLTSILTQLLSNTTTSVLMAPIALAAAQALDVRPYAFLAAVAIAASMAFATPVASPVNTLVMGAGGYRFGDYARVGAPLTLLTLLASLLVLPLAWPL